jgi:sugar lactone lactonase YvrE
MMMTIAALLLQAKAELVAEGLNEPFGVDFDAAGSMYIVELAGNGVKRLGKDGKVVRVAGTGKKGFSGDGGPALEAEFNGPHHLLIGPEGHVYIADTWNNCVRKLDPATGKVHRVAGTGEKGNSGDGGPALQAKFGGVFAIAFDAKKETLYITDLDSRRIRKLSLKTGIVSPVAGNGQKGVPQDGAEAVSQPLADPRACAVDSKGSVYVLERGGHALRVVDPSGRIRTVAGTGKPGLSGDGGPALQAQMNGPKHISTDSNDDVLIADAETNTVRKYLAKEGKIVRVAGTGKKGAAGVGGPAEQCELARPHGVQQGPDGALYVTDSYNHRILRVR